MTNYYTLLLIIFSQLAPSVAAGQGPVPLTFQEILNQELVDFKLTGASDLDSNEVYQDFNGVYYGKSVLLEISNKDTVDYILSGGLGLTLICEDSLVQDMVLTENIICLIPKRKTIKTYIYAMCAEYHDAMPNMSSRYNLGITSNSEIYRVAQIISEERLQNIVGQTALWIVTDNIDYGMAQKYGVSTVDFDRARNISLSKPNNIHAEINEEKFRPYIYLMMIFIVLSIGVVTVYKVLRRRP